MNAFHFSLITGSNSPEFVSNQSGFVPLRFKSEEGFVMYDIPEAFPGFCYIIVKHICDGILKRFNESHHQLRVMSLVGIYVRLPSFLKW